MERSRDLKEEMNGLMRDLTFCLQRTLPSKQFHAQLMLGTVALGLILKQLLHARDPTEQEMLQQEFERGLKTVRHGIELLWRTGRFSYPSNEVPSPNGFAQLPGPLHPSHEAKRPPTFRKGGETHVEHTNERGAREAAQAL